MKTSLCSMLATALVIGSVVLIGCSGKDGDPGPAGPDGDSGKDGLGFQESTAYGNIVATFSGKQHDGKSFADTVDFKHAPLGVNGITYGSFADVSDGFHVFSLTRYYSNVDPDLQDNYIKLDLLVDTSQGHAEFFLGSCIFVTYIPTSDTSLLTIQQDFASLVTTANFKNYAYTPATGDLSFRLEFTVPQQTGSDHQGLTITADVNVKVFQEIRKKK